MSTQQILLLPGTPISFKDSGGDVVWTPADTPLGHGRISNVWDRGAGAKPMLYAWEARAKWVNAPAAGDEFRLYLVRSTASATAAKTDGGLTFGDADLTSETELATHCKYVGRVVAAAADAARCTHGVLEIADRYVALAGWNASLTKAMGATDADLEFILTPLVDEIQAAA
jgi:hypothetical protein